jgi:hypothetical protein
LVDLFERMMMHGLTNPKAFKGLEVLQFSYECNNKTQLLSSGEFCKLHYDTIPVKSASANVYFYTINSKMPNFLL